MFSRTVLTGEQSPAKASSGWKRPAGYFQASEENVELASPAWSYSLTGVRTFGEGEGNGPWQSRKSRGPLPFPIQAKLMVGAVNDPLEREADRAAEQVMRMLQPAAISSAGPSGVQRKCDCGGSCDSCKKEAQGEPHVRVQMKAASASHKAGIEAPPIVHEVLRSPGQPLDASTRELMEPRFRYDFSRVRVHTDAAAAESAKAVQAKAYTAGNHLVFGRDQFTPATQAGRQLLSHELAHVVQQRFHPTLQRQGTNQPTPGFSVNQVTYLQLVTQAIQSISGNLVHTNTLAPVIQPVLNSMVSQVIWRDEKGKEERRSRGEYPPSRHTEGGS